MEMIITNESRVQLLGFIKFKITIARVPRVIEVYVISNGLHVTSYSLILKKSWLRDVKTIDYYENDEY